MTTAILKFDTLAADVDFAPYRYCSNDAMALPVNGNIASTLIR